MRHLKSLGLVINKQLTVHHWLVRRNNPFGKTCLLKKVGQRKG